MITLYILFYRVVIFLLEDTKLIFFLLFLEKAFNVTSASLCKPAVGHRPGMFFGEFTQFTGFAAPVSSFKSMPRKISKRTNHKEGGRKYSNLPNRLYNGQYSDANYFMPAHYLPLLVPPSMSKNRMPA